MAQSAPAIGTLLDANAFDAHFFAGHPWRARYYEWRYQRRRRALLRGAFRDMRWGYLDLAFQQLDWIEVGRHRPAGQSFDAFEAAALAARDKLAELMKDLHAVTGPDGEPKDTDRVQIDVEARTATIGPPPG